MFKSWTHSGTWLASTPTSWPNTDCYIVRFFSCQSKTVFRLFCSFMPARNCVQSVLLFHASQTLRSVCFALSCQPDTVFSLFCSFMPVRNCVQSVWLVHASQAVFSLFRSSMPVRLCSVCFALFLSTGPVMLPCSGPPLTSASKITQHCKIQVLSSEREAAWPPNEWSWQLQLSVNRTVVPKTQ